MSSSKDKEDKKKLKALKDKEKLAELTKKAEREAIKVYRDTLKGKGLTHDQPQNALTNSFMRVKTFGKDKLELVEIIDGVIRIQEHLSIGTLEYLVAYTADGREIDLRKAVKEVIDENTKDVFSFILQQARLKLLPGRDSITISAADYAKRRGIKDNKYAKKKLWQGLERLHLISIKFKAKDKNKFENIGLWQIIGDVDKVYGGLEVQLGKRTIEMLTNPLSPFYMTNMQTSVSVPRLNFRYHTHAISISNYLAQLLHIKATTTTDVRLSTIIEKAADVPTLEEIAEGNRNVKQQRILPVLKELENLNDIGAYVITYLNASTGAPIYDTDIDITKDFEAAAQEKPLEDYDPNDIIVRVSYPVVEVE